MKNLQKIGYVAMVCLIFLLVAGCSVVPEEYAEAEKLCQPHGGLERYYNPFVLNDALVGDALCKDGLVINRHNTEGD